MLERLGTAYFATISLFLYLFFVSFRTELRPRRPGIKVPASEPEASCSRPDSNKDPSCNGPVAHQIIRMEPNVLLLVRKFGEGVPAQVLSLSPANGSK
ncbi:hypothetical protein AVEN_253364-1 [Araneus ventricosus]|uniref:Uncharacterized protein n=1 Tax=Araneus ventricosus TaxID=182803 RepID=A0A4Y2N3X8_ARAVE|nr:hypothetical protein AVEN_253364-1 [Araneus ventricosus]